MPAPTCTDRYSHPCRFGNVPLGTSPAHFLGNYSAQGIGRIGFDLDIFSGTQAPNRAITFAKTDSMCQPDIAPHRLPAKHRFKFTARSSNSRYSSRETSTAPN